MKTTDPNFLTPEVSATTKYRLPAEWEPHAGTWLSWPHNRETWPHDLPAVEQSFVHMVSALVSGEAVHINVLDDRHRQHVSALLHANGVSGPVYLHNIPTNDAWVRDHGPLVVRDPEHSLVAVDCRFNAWGEKYQPFDDDDAAAALMAQKLRLPVCREDFVFEGGALDVNGRGLALTTRQCLLNPNRNPALNVLEIEHLLARLFGVEQLIWLDEGIMGDDTDGHVDDITRFVSDSCIVTAVEHDTSDENYAPLRTNLDTLKNWHKGCDHPLSIIELPMPRARLSGDDRLPASYANFYIANACVLMPAFADPLDAEAAEILQRCFPDRPVVSIDARELVKGLGTIHCLTQQIPA